MDLDALLVYVYLIGGATEGNQLMQKLTRMFIIFGIVYESQWFCAHVVVGLDVDWVLSKLIDPRRFLVFSCFCPLYFVFGI